jgi:hypothetical protein
MRSSLPIVFASAIAIASSHAVTAQGPQPQPATPCQSVTGIQLVCGQEAPEDLVVVRGSQWVVASAYAGMGGINLIRVSDRSTVHAYPSATAKKRFDAKTYAGCPGPPDAAADAKFTTHGLWIESGRGSVHKLFVVGHGSRESIEVFEVDSRGATPVVTWIGCAVAPDPVGLNSVRGLPDGGFIATNFLARGITAEARQKMLAGDKNGELWEWHTKSGWQKIAGSEAAGANGLELSDDGKTMYVAAWGTQSFFRLSRGPSTPLRASGASPKRDEVPLGFRVDNIRWAKDGSLLAAGQGQGSTNVVKIDPKTLAITKVLQRTDDASFRAGTVAVEIGDRLWIGSFTGDRIAILQPQ